jgi:hypothetical protein
MTNAELSLKLDRDLAENAHEGIAHAGRLGGVPTLSIRMLRCFANFCAFGDVLCSPGDRSTAIA